MGTRRKANPSETPFEPECSPGVNALLEPMTEEQRRAFLKPINRLGWEFIEDIQKGKALTMSPLHNWTFEHGEHQLVLCASRGASGIVRIECRTLGETMESLSPANIIGALLGLGEA